MYPQTKKRTCTEMDSDSDIDKQNGNTSNPSFPRFLLIESNLPEQAITSLSPFVIQKCLLSLAGLPKSVKKLKSGALLIEVEKKAHADNLLKLKTFFNISAKCSAHNTLNTSKGIIRCPDLAGVSEEEIASELAGQLVVHVRRMTSYRDSIKRPTNTLVLTFNTAILPRSLKVGYLNVPVDMYIPNPLQCYTCYKYGHHESKCRKTTEEKVCRRCTALCSEHDADVNECKNALKCSNCGGEHYSTSRSCLVWKREKEIVTVKCKEGLSFPEAKKIVETRFNLTVSYANVTKNNSGPTTIRPVVNTPPPSQECTTCHRLLKVLSQKFPDISLQLKAIMSNEQPSTSILSSLPSMNKDTCSNTASSSKENESSSKQIESSSKEIRSPSPGEVESSPREIKLSSSGEIESSPGGIGSSSREVDSSKGKESSKVVKNNSNHTSKSPDTKKSSIISLKPNQQNKPKLKLHSKPDSEGFEKQKTKKNKVQLDRASDSKPKITNRYQTLDDMETQETEPPSPWSGTTDDWNQNIDSWHNAIPEIKICEPVSK